MRPVFANIINSVAKNQAALFIQNVVPINRNLAKINFKSTNDLELKNFQETISSVFNNKVSLVEGTLIKVGAETFSAFLKFKGQVMAFNSDNIRNHKLRQVTSNVFASDEDEIWNVVGDSLVRSIDDDLSEVISKAKRRDVSVAAYSPIEKYHPNNGVFAMYVSENSSVKFGYLVTSNLGHQIVSRESIEDISKSQILETIYSSSDPILKLIGQANMDKVVSNYDIEKFINYIRQVYSYSPEFLEKYIEALNNIVIDDKKPEMATVSGVEEVKDTRMKLRVRHNKSGKIYDVFPEVSSISILAPSADPRTWAVDSNFKFKDLPTNTIYDCTILHIER